MTTNDDRKVISRKAVMDAWYEAQDAIIAETEAQENFRHLHKIAEEKKRIFYDLINLAEDYEDLRRVDNGEQRETKL